LAIFANQEHDHSLDSGQVIASYKSKDYFRTWMIKKSKVAAKKTLESTAKTAITWKRELNWV